MEEKIQKTEENATYKIAIFVMSGDMDKVWGALAIALQAASVGIKVIMYFTLWGTQPIRKPKKLSKLGNWMTKMFLWMFPGGPNKLGLSKIDMGGIGPWMMKQMMKRGNLASVSSMFEDAKELGIKMYGCEATAALLDLKKEDLMDGVEIVSILDFVKEGLDANMSLFI